MRKLIRRRDGFGHFHPFDLFKDLVEDFDQFLQFPLLKYGRGAETLSSFSPAIDITDSEKEIKVKAELPGLNREEIQVTIQDNILSIKGKKKEETESKHKGYYRAERSYGSFHRYFTLPAKIDTTKVKANYKNGVLELPLPKLESAKSKQIEVKIE